MKESLSITYFKNNIMYNIMLRMFTQLCPVFTLKYVALLLKEDYFYLLSYIALRQKL